MLFCLIGKAFIVAMEHTVKYEYQMRLEKVKKKMRVGIRVIIFIGKKILGQAVLKHQAVPAEK